MNRREALSAIGAGVGGSIFPWPESIFAQVPSFGEWKENSATRLYESLLRPRLEDIRQRRTIYALTSGEWNRLAKNHQILWDEHSRLANLHHVDLAIQARQAEIRRKFLSRKEGGKALDLLLKDGSHSVLSRNTPAFESTAKYIRSHPYGQTTFNPQLPAGDCALVFTEWSMAMDITALITAEVPPVSVIFAILGIIDSLLAAIFGSLPDGLCPL